MARRVDQTLQQSAIEQSKSGIFDGTSQSNYFSCQNIQNSQISNLSKLKNFDTKLSQSQIKWPQSQTKPYLKEVSVISNQFESFNNNQLHFFEEMEPHQSKKSKSIKRKSSSPSKSKLSMNLRQLLREEARQKEYWKTKAVQFEEELLKLQTLKDKHSLLEMKMTKEKSANIDIINHMNSAHDKIIQNLQIENQALCKRIEQLKDQNLETLKFSGDRSDLQVELNKLTSQIYDLKTENLLIKELQQEQQQEETVAVLLKYFLIGVEVERLKTVLVSKERIIQAVKVS